MKTNNKKNGLTILETLVSLGLVVFIAATFISSLTGFLKMNKSNNELFIASQLIKVQIEKYKALGSPPIGTYDIEPNSILPSDENVVKNIYKNIKINVIVSSNPNPSINLKKVQVIAYKVDRNNQKVASSDGVTQVLDQYVIYLN